MIEDFLKDNDRPRRLHDDELERLQRRVNRASIDAPEDETSFAVTELKPLAPGQDTPRQHVRTWPQRGMVEVAAAIVVAIFGALIYNAAYSGGSTVDASDTTPVSSPQLEEPSGPPKQGTSAQDTHSGSSSQWIGFCSTEYAQLASGIQHWGTIEDWALVTDTRDQEPDLMRLSQEALDTLIEIDNNAVVVKASEELADAIEASKELSESNPALARQQAVTNAVTAVEQQVDASMKADIAGCSESLTPDEP